MTDQATSAWDSRVSRVYFISDAYGYVKIGTSLDVEMRMQEIQRHNARPVRLLATVPGGLKRERELHARFASSRLLGEWFAPTTELLAFIGDIATTEEAAA